jgi:hypothetical protein
MARGKSGRIVLEIGPTEKDELYNALTRDGLTLKDWFLRRATEYLRNREQGQLFRPDMLAEGHTPYRVSGEAEAKGREKPKGKRRGL